MKLKLLCDDQLSLFKPFALNRNYKLSILEVIENNDNNLKYRYLSVSGPAELNKRYYTILNNPKTYHNFNFEDGNSSNQKLLGSQYRSWIKFSP